MNKTENRKILDDVEEIANNTTPPDIQKIARHMSMRPTNVRTLHGRFRIGRNSLCYCGSGLKFKHCHFGEYTKNISGNTPETAKALKKDQIYLQKQLKKARGEG